MSTIETLSLHKLKLNKIKFSFLNNDAMIKAVLLLLTFAAGVLLSPVRQGRTIFLEWQNFADILRQVSETGILGIGMTLVILTGGIDLSVGSVLALSATLMSSALMLWHWSLPLSIFFTLSIGLFTGLFFSIFISRFRIPAFIVTLAGMGALRGVARLIAGGSSISITEDAPAGFFNLAARSIFSIPISFPSVVFLILAIFFAFWLKRTITGRHLYAVGGSLKASRFAGISTTRTLFFAYGLCSLMASIAGILHAAQLEQGNPNDGMGYELDAIAAVVLGGTRLSGGVGSIFGVVFGTLIIGMINNLLGLNNVDINLQMIIKGALILFAMVFQKNE